MTTPGKGKTYSRGAPTTSGNPQAFDQEVKDHAAWLLIQHEARRRVNDQMRPAVNYPPVRSLKDLLAQHFPPQRYRVDQVAPSDGRVLLAAQFKAGKTTLVGNLARSLADGTPFLGKFDVPSTAAAIVVIDDEMSERQTQQWLADQHIANPGNVADVITLRGNVGAFNLLDEHCLAQWMKRLAQLGCDYLILDCLRPVLDVLGLDENHDAGRLLTAFDTLMLQAGIADACLIQHMGHTGERARGGSRFKDWPDATWRLVREDDEPGSPRYFSAYGRDVDVPEGRLSFDPATRHLTYTAGSRADVKVDAAIVAVIKLLAADSLAGGEGLSVQAIATALTLEHSRDVVRKALKRELASWMSRIGSKTGAHNAHLHYLLRLRHVRDADHQRRRFVSPELRWPVNTLSSLVRSSSRPLTRKRVSQFASSLCKSSELTANWNPPMTHPVRELSSSPKPSVSTTNGAPHTDEHITAVQLDEVIAGLMADDIAEMWAHVPVDRADQQVAAHAQALELISQRGPVLNLPHGEIPEWLRLGLLDTHLAWVDGRAKTCLHQPNYYRPEPTFACAWKPNLVVCGRCTHLLGAVGDANWLCDACGHRCAGDDSDAIYVGVLGFGHLVYDYGTCSDCRPNFTDAA